VIIDAGLRGRLFVEV
jgi:hypothetical protein